MDKFVENCIGKDDECNSEIFQTAVDMQKGLCKLSDLIQALGSYLTAKDVAVRVQACTLLRKILQKLSDTYLSTNELSHLSEFLCSKLQDHYTLQPSVLSSLVKVTSGTNLDKTDAKNIINTLFKEVHVSSSLQNERHKVFQILSNVFDSFKEVIVSLGRDFVYNYIQAIDGEQDPRNLLIIFQLSSGLVKSGIDLNNLEEEFFEVASCYFPIDFNPSSAGKKSTITNHDLVLGLRKVLSSSAVFSQYCIPLCLEKMESDVETAKLDAILTLTECLSKYSKNNLEPHLTSLWYRLKQEITQVTSQEVEKGALGLLTELVNNLSHWPVDVAPNGMCDLNSFLSEVLSDCLPRFEEPIQDKLTWMSGLMVLACAKGSKAAYSHISSVVLPLLLRKIHQLQSEKSPNTPASLPLLPGGMHTVLEYMVKIMALCSSFSYQQTDHPLLGEYKSILQLCKTLLSGDYSVQIKCISVAGIASLFKLDILTTEDVEGVFDCMYTLVCSERDKKLIGESLSALGYMSSKHPLIVKSMLLPNAYKIIPEENFVALPVITVKKAFSLLCALSTHVEILKDVTAYIVKLVNSCKIDEFHSLFLAECLGSLQQITKGCSADQASIDHLSLQVAMPLIKKAIEASLQLLPPEQCCAGCDITSKFSSIDCISLPFLKSVAGVVRNTCQKLKGGKTANLIVEQVSDLYLKKDVTVIGILQAEKSLSFDPFNLNLSLFQSRTVCFIAASICALDQSIEIPQAQALMSNLVELSLNSTDQLTYVSAAKSFAGLLNKCRNSSDEIIEKVQQLCESCRKTQSAIGSKKMNILTLLIWTTKALILCNHKKTKNILQDLLAFLCDSEVGEIAAASFDIILRDSEEVLNSASHAVIRMMYKQRFFLLVLPELTSGFNAACEEMSDSNEDGTSFHQQKRANHLTALSHLLLHLPKQVLLQEFPRLFPLLVHALRSQDCLLLHSVLSAIYFLLQDASELIEGDIDRLMNDFLRLSRFQSDMHVRLKALQCVGASTMLSTPAILPLKSDVTRKLSRVLDDPKRDVRSEAAKARAEWYLVGV